VPTSSRILFHLSRLMVAEFQSRIWLVAAERRERLGSGWAVGAGGRCDVDRRLPAAPGARERRGAACADLLPADSSTFPVKGCSSSRESG
jgi:hypothetical protein